MGEAGGECEERGDILNYFLWFLLFYENMRTSVREDMGGRTLKG